MSQEPFILILMMIKIYNSSQNSMYDWQSHPSTHPTIRRDFCNPNFTLELTHQQQSQILFLQN